MLSGGHNTNYAQTKTISDTAYKLRTHLTAVYGLQYNGKPILCCGIQISLEIHSLLRLMTMCEGCMLHTQERNGIFETLHSGGSATGLERERIDQDLESRIMIFESYNC